METKNIIKINDHPFYQDPRFVTEKKILERLTEICGFDDSIGVIDSFPDAPVIEIGFIKEGTEEERKNKMPSFKSRSKITIYLTGGSSEGPFSIPEELSFHAIRKILVPLVQHWLEVVTFLVEFYGTDPKSKKHFLDTCKKSLKIWKKEFGN